jgi:hypothetical protein
MFHSKKTFEIQFKNTSLWSIASVILISALGLLLRLRDEDWDPCSKWTAIVGKRAGSHEVEDKPFGLNETLDSRFVFLHNLFTSTCRSFLF